MNSRGWFSNRALRKRHRAAVVAALTLLGLVSYVAPAQAAPPPPMSASALGSMFGAYGDAGGHWTGGDGTMSIALPDGRVAWFFSDTFLGVVKADHTRPASTPMVNNTIVVQTGTALGATLHGGTESAPRAMVTPTQQGEFYWVGDGLVADGVLKVIYNRFRSTGTGALDFTHTGTALATFALPALTLTSVTELSVGSTITWGAALVPAEDYTYIYGSSSAPGRMNFGHVARVPAGALGDPWQYWTGETWSSDAKNATRLLSGVGTGYSVQKVGSQYVLVTQESNLLFDPQFVAYTAPSPTGPFTGPTYLYTAPEPAPGSSKIVYDAKLHPALAASGKLLMSYNVNSLTHGDNLADTRLYRPRFVELTWPPAPSADDVPLAPTGLAATGRDDFVSLTWSAVPGATSYRVYQRDVTAGQTHFARQPTATTVPSLRTGLLIPGHRYEFKVTSVNARGEGAAGAAVTATPQSTMAVATAIRGANKPRSIAGSYIVRLKGNAGQPERLGAYAQQLVAQAGGTLGPVLTRALRGFGATLTQAQAVNLAAHPDVLDVEQNRSYTVAGEQANPPWSLDRIDQRTPVLDQKYRYPNDASSVHAYVVDSGVRATHETFGGRVRQGFNATGVGDEADTTEADCEGHGTGVAAALGGAEYGAAKDVQIVPVKVLSCVNNKWVGDALGVARGIDWAIKDAASHRPAVINLSLSAEADPDGPDGVDNAVQVALGDGITVVVAAGNDGSDACLASPSRAAKTSAAISVGATDRSDAAASFTNWGQCVDIHAPGVAVTTANYLNDTDTTVANGTSFAAPFVSGAAAMLLEAHPEYSPADVKKAIVADATTDVITDIEADTPNRLLYVERPPTVAPRDLAATAQTDGTIRLSWTAATEPNMHYLVSSRDVTAEEDAFERWPDPVFDANTTSAKGLIEGHTYEFRVAAANSAGTGPESNVASAVAHLAPPPAPTGLTATTLADGTIGLEWSSLGADVWYWVYQRDLTAEQTTFSKLELPITTNSMNAGYLVDGHLYEYVVTGFNPGGEGPQSTPSSATSRYPAAGAPKDLTAKAGDTVVQLSWSASVTPDVWYLVYQRDVTAGEDAFTMLPYPVTTCCTMSGGYLTNGHTYEYKITATGSGSESAPSNVVSVTPQLPLPGPVTDLTAEPQTDGSIWLEWIAPQADVYFDIFVRDVTAHQEFSKLAYPVTTCCTFNATLLTHNHVYEFKVDAINSAGAGEQSNVATATARYDRPGAPKNLRGTAAGDGSIDLDWDPPGPGGFYYWIYQRDATAGAPFVRGAYPTDTTAATAPMLIHGHVYEFKVSAENSGGEGEPSAAIPVTARGGTPAAPTALTATAGNGQAILRWTASPTPSVLYSVYQRDVTAGQSWQKLPLPVTGTTLTAGGLTNGHAYQWKVAAINASGESAASSVAGATPLPPLPTAPTGLTATAGDGEVTLRWTASSTPPVYYWLESRPAGGAWQRMKYPITTCCSFEALHLANGTTYEFRLRSVNVAGDSAPSVSASARPMPPFPQPPTNVTATPGDGSATLRWTASSPSGVYYWVEMKAQGGSWQRLKYPVTTCCSLPARPLMNGVTYEFRLRAMNIAGESAPSNVASVRPMPPIPVAPSGLAVSPESSSSVNLTWHASPTQPVYYRIGMRNVTRGGGWTTVIGPYISATNSTVPYLRAGVYEFRVVAVNITGTSPPSPVVSTRVSYIYTECGIFCGEVRNNSNTKIMIANNWCRDGQNIEDKNKISDESLKCARATERYLNIQSSSKEVFQDTDAFRAPSGCITRLRWDGSADGPVDDYIDIDRRGRGSEWHRVRSYQTAYVSFIRCS